MPRVGRASCPLRRRNRHGATRGGAGPGARARLLLEGLLERPAPPGTPSNGQLSSASPGRPCCNSERSGSANTSNAPLSGSPARHSGSGQPAQVQSAAPPAAPPCRRPGFGQPCSREAGQHKQHKLRPHASLVGGGEPSGDSTSVYSNPAGAEDAMKSIFWGCKPDQNLRRGGVERMGAASKQH